MTDSLTNELHAALIKMTDIARNGKRNDIAWQDVLEVATTALERGRDRGRNEEDGCRDEAKGCANA